MTFAGVLVAVIGVVFFVGLYISVYTIVRDLFK
jgi:hypothetical protein